MIITQRAAGKATGLAAIGIIAAMIWWTHLAVEYANEQRRVTSEIGRRLTELRLVTFEYHLYHNERARVQWDTVSDMSTAYRERPFPRAGANANSRRIA